MERVIREYICDKCKESMGAKADFTFRGGNGETEFELHFCANCLELLLGLHPKKDEVPAEEMAETIDNYCDGILCGDCLIEDCCRHKDFWNNPNLQLEAYKRIKEIEGCI